MSERWTPDGWRTKQVAQLPAYPDARALADVEAQLATFPPLVFAGEARNLKKALARVAAWRGASCSKAGTAPKASPSMRQQHPRLLPRPAADGRRADLCRRVPVVKVGRIAGQFAKPRSSPTEKIGGVELPTYRGDIVNDIAFTAQRARPIPSASSWPIASPRRPQPAARLRDRRLRQSAACTSGCWVS